MSQNSNSESRQQKFSLIIPCYNEEDAIETTVKQLQKIFTDPQSYDLIIVNDGSTDRSGEILEKLSLDDHRLNLINHRSNLGYGASLKSGIRQAKTELIAITDADGTYPNHRIPELIEAADKADMVVGSRTGEKVEYSKIRMIPKVFLKWYSSWITGQKIPDINSGLRVFRKSVADRFLNILPSGFSFTTTITIAMLTNYYTVRYIPIDYSARIGNSKIRPIKDTLKFFQLILRTGTYFAPLRVFFPFIILLFFGFSVSLIYDVFFLKNITEKTLLFLLFTMNTGMFALISDMIDKRTNK